MKMPKSLLSMVVLCLWLGGSAWAFWWFALRHQANFNDFYVNFNGENFAQFVVQHPAKRVSIVHFIDDACPCSRFAKVHIAKLKKAFKDKSEHYIWPDIPKILQQHLSDTRPVPASPAVAIWDEQGQLAYFGPYSSGAVCGTGKDFVTTTLEQLAGGLKVPRWVNHDVVGCYCPWKTKGL